MTCHSRNSTGGANTISDGSAPCKYSRKPVSEHAQNHDPEINTAKWNAAVMVVTLLVTAVIVNGLPLTSIMSR